jgi:Methyltransferase domain
VHYRKSTQEFIRTPTYEALSDIDLLFVDGYHTYEQAKFDHEAFRDKMADNYLMLFHDSVRSRNSTIYGQDKIYQHTVFEYMHELKQHRDLQVIDFSPGSGLTIVKKAH